MSVRETGVRPRAHDDLAVEIVQYLYHDCDYSINQIASELDIPATTVHWWLSDGRRRSLRPREQVRLEKLPGTRGKLTDLMDDVWDALRKGRSANETARRLGCGPSAITYHWRNR